MKKITQSLILSDIIIKYWNDHIDIATQDQLLKIYNKHLKRVMMIQN